jgi:tripartite-type tricarboxylate transporter receptor subunit TctC
MRGSNRTEHVVTRVILAALFAVAAVASHAQGYPSKPVRIIVPFAAGGVADLLPRIVGEKLSQKWGQPVIVENKPGASGNIGMEQGARAAADGYTLVLAPTGNLTVNPSLFPKLSFDTHKDLAPITVLASSPNVLVVHPLVPARSFKELVAYAKANPGKLNFASPGEGSGAHLAGELLNIEAGIRATHVPYKGIAPAVNDLLGGNVQMMFAGISTVIQHVRGGKLVALAVASPTRSSQLADVPTVAESGIPGFDVTSWYGLVVRAGTPPEIIQQLHRDIVEALSQADVRERLSGLGLVPIGNRPEEFQRMIESESRKWSEIVRKAGIPAQQ